MQRECNTIKISSTVLRTSQKHIIVDSTNKRFFSCDVFNISKKLYDLYKAIPG